MINVLKPSYRHVPATLEPSRSWNPETAVKLCDDISGGALCGSDVKWRDGELPDGVHLVPESLFVGMICVDDAVIHRWTSFEEAPQPGMSE